MFNQGIRRVQNVCRGYSYSGHWEIIENDAET